MADDAVEFGACAVVVGLGEHGAVECGDEIAVPVAGGGVQVAHGVDAAALPEAALHHPGDCGGEIPGLGL